jgi:chromosomal replication initiator protein
MDTITLWKTVLNDIELQVSKASYQTLFSQTYLLSFDEKKVIIGCAQPLLISLIERRYADLIKHTIKNYTNQNVDIEFKAVPKENKPSIDAPLFTLSIPERQEKNDIPLNPDYTFKNFAVSSSNQMAYAAATAVANSPGASYNPLFLYGGVGVGKTHLMQAIAHVILSGKPKTKIIYCTGEEFTNEIIEAISTKNTTYFKKKYRKAELLLIDDIQFIAGKYAIQEEFFHTFNAIQQLKGQIVLTSDRPPEEINKLEARLKSRFEGGLTIDIGQPDFELRTAILLIKAKQKNIILQTNIAQIIAANVENPRKLEGVLIRIITEAQTRNINIDEDLVKKILGKSVDINIKSKTISPAMVLKEVCEYYNLKTSYLKGDKRDKIYSLPRQMLYYLLKTELNIPLMEIGEFLGGRDHTTILHGVRKINNLLSTDDKIKTDVLGIKSKIFG